jgi:hypothetical protein
VVEICGRTGLEFLECDFLKGPAPSGHRFNVFPRYCELSHTGCVPKTKEA